MELSRLSVIYAPNNLTGGCLIETYLRLRKELEALAAAERRRKQHKALRVLALVREQYQAAFDFATLIAKQSGHAKSHQRHLCHIKKEITGLEQLLLQRAVRRPWSSAPPFSLLHRLRRLTVTHPAIAPPQFA